jgi:hypothetical protein
MSQLSGDFFIDGGGSFIAGRGTVKISGLTLAEAQELIQKQLAGRCPRSAGSKCAHQGI